MLNNQNLNKKLKETNLKKYKIDPVTFIGNNKWKFPMEIVLLRTQNLKNLTLVQ